MTLRVESVLAGVVVLMSAAALTNAQQPKEGRSSYDIEGIVTNISIHKALLASDAFLEGKMTTNLLDRVGGAAFLAAAARA